MDRVIDSTVSWQDQNKIPMEYGVNMNLSITKSINTTYTPFNGTGHQYFEGSNSLFSGEFQFRDFPDDYDSRGASVFVTGLLAVYGLAILMFIISLIRKSRNELELVC